MPSLITLESIEKKEWSDQQLERRKKLSGATSVVTSTMGLGALGVMGLRSKGGKQAIKHLAPHQPQIAGRLKKIRSGLKGKETPILTTSAGIGGLGGYNYAAIQRQEAQKQKKQNAQSTALKAKVNRLAKSYDPEEERHKQNKIGAATLGVAGAGGIAAAVPQGLEANRQRGRIKTLKTKSAKARAGRIMRAKGGKAALLALGGAGAIGGGVKLATNEKSRRGKTYAPAYRPQYY
jgi:hypothetical protein